MKTIFRVVFFCAALLFSFAANAIVISMPTQDADGNYTIAWSGIRSYVELREQINGVWTGINGSPATSHNVTGKPPGTYSYNIKDCFVSGGPGGTSTSCTDNFRTVIVGTQPPAISSITDKTINEDGSIAFGFSVSDADTPVANLIVTAVSENQSVIANSGVQLSGTNPNRTITLLPLPNANGSAVIRISANDGSKTTDRTFTLHVTAVNDIPSISNITDISITGSALVNFTVSDVESLSSLQISATSTNTTLIPVGGLVFSGSGNNRSLTITPTANLSGSSTITVNVSDGSASVSDSFIVNVTDINDSPTISDIANSSINEDTNISNLPFTVFDPDSPSLQVSAVSSNKVLVPDANISISGSGNNRSISLIPTANQSGVTTITVSVSDGQYTASDAFLVTVNSINDAPIISAVANQTTNQETPIIIEVITSDIDSALITLTASSSSGPISTSNIVVDNGSSPKKLTITPPIATFGTSTINLVVSDGSTTSSSSFNLTVNDISTQLFIHSNDGAGNYTLSWKYGNQTVKLLEKRNSEAEVDVGVSSPSGSRNFNKNLYGTYVYTLQECVHAQTITCSNVDTKTVIVTLPLPVVTTSVTPATISEGGTATVSWSATHSTSCSSNSIAGVSATSGSVTYTAPSVMSANQNLNFLITCTGGGGSANGSANLTVNWANDTPILSVASTASTNEDTQLAIPFSVSDEETSVANLTWNILSSNASVVPVSNVQVDLGQNRLLVTPLANTFGSTTISIRVTDPNGAFVDRQISVTVNSVNDVPVITPVGNQATNQETPLTFDVSVSDIESPVTLTITSVTGALSISNVIVNNLSTPKKVTVSPQIAQHGASTINLHAEDQNGGVSTSSVQLTVNDIPAKLFVESNDGAGNYTLSWKYGNQTVKLLEKRNSEAEVDVGVSSPSGSRNFNKNLDGTYVYTLQECAHAQTIICSDVDTKTITVTLPAPSAPTLTASVNSSLDGNYLLNWSSVARANIYELYENDVLVENVNDPLWFTHSLSNKRSGLYTYKVRACNVGGCSAYSSIQVKVANTSSTIWGSVTATMNPLTAVVAVGWASLINENRNFEIQQQMGSGDWTGAYTGKAQYVSLPAVNLAGTYTYRVRACDTVVDLVSCSTWNLSNSVSISLPEIPDISSIDSNNITGNFEISWSIVPLVLQYVVNENGVDLPPITAAYLSKQFSGKPNASYVYKIKACNAVGCSSYSPVTQVNVARIGDMGAVFAVLNDESLRVSLSWAAVSGANQYEIQPIKEGINQGQPLVVSATNFTMDGLTDGGVYTYQVKACAFYGGFKNCSTSQLSNSITLGAPSAAPNLSTPANSVTGVFNIKWTSVTDADKYELLENGILISTTTSTTYTHATARATGNYSYQVRACKTLCGGLSNTAQTKVVISNSTISTDIVNPTAFDPLNDFLDGDIYYGQLAGRQSVGQDGSFNYTLPITLPAGINGMQPSLSLGYNSNSRNGLLGWGWSLQGLSVISRCNADTIRDGYDSSIETGQNFKYCLDGQRLIEVAADEYRTEVESFLRIKKFTDYWQVLDNSGRETLYGNSEDSKQQDTQNQTYVWHMMQKIDAAGNSWVVTYDKNATTNTHSPRQIDYTTTALFPAQFSIIFDYESREDINLKTVAGVKIRTDKRLSLITVKSAGTRIKTIDLEYQQTGQTYHGKLSDDPARTSRLAKITQCFASDSVCSDPVEFDWNDQSSANYQFVQREEQGTPASESYSNKILIGVNAQGQNIYYDGWGKAIDINGDGFKDIVKNAATVYLNENNVISSTPSSSYSLTADQISYRGVVNRAYYQSQIEGGNLAPLENDPNPKTLQYELSFTDINADGLVDVIRYPHNSCTGTSDPNIYCWITNSPNEAPAATDISVAINTGSGFGAFTTWVANWSCVGCKRERFRISFSDFNADGMLDMYAVLQYQISQWIIVGLNNGLGANGDQFTLYDLGSSANPDSVIGDFNGDGIYDIAVIENYSSIKTHYGTGTANPAPSGLGLKGFSESYTTLSNFQPMLACSSGRQHNGFYRDFCRKSSFDFNGDGLTDIIQHAYRETVNENPRRVISSEHQVFISRGTRFASPITYRNDVRESHFDDYNNDGSYEDNRLLNNRIKTNRLERVVESSRNLSIDYSTLAGTEIYKSIPDNSTDQNLTSYVFEDKILRARKGVKTLRVTNGVGGETKSEYRYSGARSPAGSLGDLGFAQVAKLDTVTGKTPVKTVSYYYQKAQTLGAQKYKLAGRLKQQQVYLSDSSWGNGQLLSDTRYQWKIRLYSDDHDSGFVSPHYFPYLYESSTETWDIDGTKVATSVSQPHSFTTSSCTPLPVDPAILTTAFGDSANDNDYHATGVLLYNQTVTCDTSGSAQSVQVQASFADNLTTKGNARGLVGRQYAYAWAGSSVADAVRTAYSSRITDFTYNATGQLESKTIEPGSGASRLKLKTTLAYNPIGSVSSVMETWDDVANDGLSEVTRTTYINETFVDNKRIISVTNPKGQIETSEFHPVFGAVTKHTDINGLETLTEYDDSGRPTLVTYADGTKDEMAYRTCSYCSYQHPNAVWYTQSKSTGSTAERVYYDGFGRTLGGQSTDFEGYPVYSLQQYAVSGELEQASSTFGYAEQPKWTRYEYDAIGRVTRINYPGNQYETNEYRGLQQIRTNRLGQRQTQYLNAAGWVLKSVDNANTPVDFTYTHFGDLSTTLVNNNPDTKITVDYDNLGRKTSLIDPNTGTTTYTYNGLDLLATEVNAKAQRTCYFYDVLGRQEKRVDLASSTCTGTATHNWAYDTRPMGKGQVASMSGLSTDNSSYTESYDYTGFGLPKTSSRSFGGVTYSTTQHYDSFNRPIAVTYPSGYTAGNRYNAYGYLNKVVDSTGVNLWTADSITAEGQLTQYTLGNGVVTQQAYNLNTGMIDSIKARKGSLVVQDQAYVFDDLGNLKTREDKKAGITQSFCYDNMNRLTSSSFSGCSQASNDNVYDPLGNLTQKTEDGISKALAYTGRGQSINSKGPHAVTAYDGWTFAYDQTGNLTEATKDGQATKTVVYSPFNTPTSITQGTKFSNLVYSPHQDRIKHTDSNGRSTIYVGGIYEEVTKAGVTQKIHYVGDSITFIQTGGATPTNKHEYLHRDHLGSIVAITNSNANSESDIQRQSNGAWGERRFEQWNGPVDNTLIPSGSAHGFTDHEHMDAVGLLHMNGRVYDPELGRFLSADPLIQAPYNTQSYNRYSYVFNNPLSFTDPSGYCSSSVTRNGSHSTLTQSQGICHPGDYVFDEINRQRREEQNQHNQNNNYWHSYGPPLGVDGVIASQYAGCGMNSECLMETAVTDAKAQVTAITSFVSIEGMVVVRLALMAKNSEKAKELYKLIQALNDVAKSKAGFKKDGLPIILDNNLSHKLAESLRDKGFNVRSVREIFGKDPGDSMINKLSDIIKGRVLTQDKGRDLGGGFGQNAINVDGRASGLDSLEKILKSELDL